MIISMQLYFTQIEKMTTNTVVDKKVNKGTLTTQKS